MKAKRKQQLKRTKAAPAPAPAAPAPARVAAPARPQVYVGTVYLNAQRNSAIVGRVKEGVVTAAIMPRTYGEEREICLVSMSVERFASDYPIGLPLYPVRRAARIYLDSTIPKHPDAARALRAVLARAT